MAAIAAKVMESVTLAYKTLTDEDARRKYDERLAASSAFTLGQRPSDVQKTAEDCLEKARECFKARNSGGNNFVVAQGRGEGAEFQPVPRAAGARSLGRGIHAARGRGTF